MTLLAEIDVYRPEEPAVVLAEAAERLILAVTNGRRDPMWHTEALCRGTMRGGVSPWFTSHRGDQATAKALCAACPVAGDCSQARQPHGIWGGASMREVAA